MRRVMVSGLCTFLLLLGIAGPAVADEPVDPETTDAVGASDTADTTDTDVTAEVDETIDTDDTPDTDEGPGSDATSDGGEAPDSDETPDESQASTTASSTDVDAAILTDEGASADEADGDGWSCGDPVTEDLTLTEDLPCGLTIAASGVTVDLGGHTVGGDITTVELDWSDPQPLVDLVIRNGSLAPGAGIHFRFGNWVGGRTEATVEDVRLSGAGITAGEAAILELRSVRITGAAAGLDLFRARLVTLERSRLTDNGTGARLEDTEIGRVRFNRFEGNDVGMRWWEAEHGNLGAGAVISGNRFRHNGTGLDIEPVVTGIDTTISHNDFSRNDGHGLRLGLEWFEPDWGPYTATITRNSFRRNGLSGLTVASADPQVAAGVSVSRNLALHNGGLGINAPGVTDDGHNLGRRNGDAAQCVGVACSR